jgi:hypothetical protein
MEGTHYVKEDLLSLTLKANNSKTTWIIFEPEKNDQAGLLAGVLETFKVGYVVRPCDNR